MIFKIPEVQSNIIQDPLDAAPLFSDHQKPALTGRLARSSNTLRRGCRREFGKGIASDEQTSCRSRSGLRPGDLSESFAEGIRACRSVIRRARPCSESPLRKIGSTSPHCSTNLCLKHLSGIWRTESTIRGFCPACAGSAVCRVFPVPHLGHFRP